MEDGVQLLVVDEVGPMELESGGWAAALDVLCMQANQKQIWVVRDGILDAAIRKWHIVPSKIIPADSASLETSVRSIIAYAKNNESRPAT
jgi:nucleoside-triphosphatase THEP1